MGERTVPSEVEILAEMKRNWAAMAAFYSNGGKEERERWVVAEFLRLLGVAFDDGEMRSLPQTSKVDVKFREANFQVKEIPDPGIRRSDEILKTYRNVMAATTLAETLASGFVYDVPPVVNGLSVVVEKASELSRRQNYENLKSEIDLLFYVTRTRVSMIESVHAAGEMLQGLGWRSVSVVMGSRSWVLSVSPAAPLFLRQGNGRR